MSDCIFCKIAGKEVPSKPVYEDALCYAFYDLEPQAPTHFLVIPKQHIASAREIDDTNAPLVGHCYAVIAKVARELGFDSYRVVNNCGVQAGQTVFHLHFHVLAGREMTWPPG